MEQSWTIYVHLKSDGFSPQKIKVTQPELQAIMENVREHGIMVIGGGQAFYYPHDSISFIDAYKQVENEQN
jgi:peptidase E